MRCSGALNKALNVVVTILCEAFNLQIPESLRSAFMKLSRAYYDTDVGVTCIVTVGCFEIRTFMSHGTSFMNEGMVLLIFPRPRA